MSGRVAGKDWKDFQSCFIDNYVYKMLESANVWKNDLYRIWYMAEIAGTFSTVSMSLEWWPTDNSGMNVKSLRVE
jgi:hypothetical protein